MHLKKVNENLIRTIIKIIIITGWIFLAGISCFIIIVDYGIERGPETDSKEIHWHIALSLFVIIMACSFFLQTMLIEIENKNDLRNKIYHALNHEHRTYSKKNQNIKTLENIIKHFGEENNHFLYQLYRQIENLLKEPQSKKDLGISDSDTSITRELSEFYIRDQVLDYIIEKKMKRDGLTLTSYILPLSLFLFAYFASFLIILPMINSLFGENTNKEFIPIFPINAPLDSVNSQIGIPLMIIQWGILGGLVYTSISLLYRFLRKDLPPRVYYNASFRILLSGAAAIIVFFLFMLFGNVNINTNANVSEDKIIEFQPTFAVLLLCFSIGIAPIQFLIRSLDIILSRFEFWKYRDTAGKRSLINIEGIDPITWERLSEESIDCIQQLALCDPIDISFKTKFPLHIVKDWNDQAILYLLSADIIVNSKDKQIKSSTQYLYNNLGDIYGIKRFSQFYFITNNLIKKYNSTKEQYQDNHSEEKLIDFCKGLGYPDSDLFKFKYIIDSIRKTGYSISELYFKHDKETNHNA